MSIPVGRANKFSALSVLLFSLFGCSSSHSPVQLPNSGAARDVLSALSVTYVRIPPLKAPYYHSSGSFPQISASRMNLSTIAAVNVSLEKSLSSAENSYAVEARQEENQQEAIGVTSAQELSDPGIYQVAPNPHFISATEVVVSALVPVLELYPGGTEGSVWLSVTLRVPSGQPVDISDLFSNRERGLQGLAAEVQSQFAASRTCGVSKTLTYAERSLLLQGSAPTAKNFKDFALTPRGLMIGFTQGQVCPLAYGRTSVTVPYSDLSKYLSSLGQRLVAGARPPVGSRP